MEALNQIPPSSGEFAEEGGMGGTLIVMEYCDRGTMESVLQRREVLWWPDGSPNQVGTLRECGVAGKVVTAWAWLLHTPWGVCEPSRLWLGKSVLAC